MNNLDQILKDLYELDPEFRNHEDKLKIIISKLLAAKPEAKISPAFVSQLRSVLIRNTNPTINDQVSNFKHNFMKKINLAAAIAVVCAILIASTLYVNDKNGNQISFFSPGVKITSAGEAAFGDLNAVTNQTQSEAGSDKAESNTTMAEPAIPGVGFGAGGGSDKLIVPPEYVSYRYVYKGEPLVLTSEKLEVLKRLKGSAILPDFSGLLENLNLGIVNLGSFGGSKLSSASFMQEGREGYFINVNLQEGDININSNWYEPVALDSTMLDSAAGLCLPKGCPMPVPLNPEEIPADDKLIAVALDFVAKHSISLEAYGPPKVQDDWKIYYENYPGDKSGYYLPEMINVIFPLIINGSEVLDESGNSTGMNIGVNIRTSKVSSVWGLQVQNYQSSMYDAETKTERILEIAQAGGLYGYYPPECSSPPFTPDGSPVPQFQTCQIVEIELGTPKIELVKMWNYKDNVSEELLIPSLVFPITKQPSPHPFYFGYRKSIVVPLIKEVLDSRQAIPMYQFPATPGVAQ